jgi:hypothetical protein
MTATSKPTIAIEFLTLAQRHRREDWAIARATIHSPIGTYGGHLIIDYANRGRLSVEPARGSILHPETRDQILEQYHRVVIKDRYFEERDLYGIWSVATCNDRPEPVKHYIIHRVTADNPADPYQDVTSSYQRIEAATIGEALTIAERTDSPGFYSYGIMAADYAEATAAGISYFEGDGLLI